MYLQYVVLVKSWFLENQPNITLWLIESYLTLFWWQRFWLKAWSFHVSIYITSVFLFNSSVGTLFVFLSSCKEVQHFFHISACPCQWEGNFLAKLSNQKFYSWIILLNLRKFFRVILYISLTLSPSFISSVHPQRKAAADSVQSGKLVLATLK